jgi:hypothetical protein
MPAGNYSFSQGLICSYKNVAIVLKMEINYIMAQWNEIIHIHSHMKKAIENFLYNIIQLWLEEERS